MFVTLHDSRHGNPTCHAYCRAELVTSSRKDASSTVSCSDTCPRIGSTGRFLCLTMIPVHLLLEPLERIAWESHSVKDDITEVERYRSYDTYVLSE